MLILFFTRCILNYQPGYNPFKIPAVPDSFQYVLLAKVLVVRKLLLKFQDKMEGSLKKQNWYYLRIENTSPQELEVILRFQSNRTIMLVKKISETSGFIFRPSYL
jgi:hypothetical protein